MFFFPSANMKNTFNVILGTFLLYSTKSYACRINSCEDLEWALSDFKGCNRIDLVDDLQCTSSMGPFSPPAQTWRKSYTRVIDGHGYTIEYDLADDLETVWWFEMNSKVTMDLTIKNLHFVNKTPRNQIGGIFMRSSGGRISIENSKFSGFMTPESNDGYAISVVPYSDGNEMENSIVLTAKNLEFQIKCSTFEDNDVALLLDLGDDKDPYLLGIENVNFERSKNWDILFFGLPEQLAIFDTEEVVKFDPLLGESKNTNKVCERISGSTCDIDGPTISFGDGKIGTDCTGMSPKIEPKLGCDLKKGVKECFGI